MKKLAFILAFTVLVAGSSLFAQQPAMSDYTNGWMDGDYDLAMEAGDNSASYWNTYLETGSQAAWDEYWGYVHGYNGQNQDYGTVPPFGGTPSGSPSITETLNNITARQQTGQHTMRNAKYFRRLRYKHWNRPKEAGDTVKDPLAAIDYSFASVDDNILGGSGHDYDLSLLLQADIGDKLGAGFALSRNLYKVGAADWNQTTDTIDGFLSYYLNERFSLGLVISFMRIDLEDQRVGGTTTLGNTLDRWGTSLMLSYDQPLSTWGNLGLTGALSSMNKTSLGKIFDDEDSSGLFMTELSVSLTDNLRWNTYGSYTGLLDRDADGSPSDPSDGSYWTFGSEFVFKWLAKADLSVGYETTASDNDYQENRLNLGLSFQF